MPQVNKTKYAILGVLSLNPGSGYDIKKFCDFSIAHFWSENYGRIYPVLRQLEGEKLVTKKTEHTTGKPSRNVYSITEKGKSELQDWLLLPVEFHPNRSELLLKLFFARDIPVGNLIQKLEKAIERQRGMLETYELLEAMMETEELYRSDTERLLWMASLSFGIRYARTIIEWCEETINTFLYLKDE